MSRARLAVWIVVAGAVVNLGVLLRNASVIAAQPDAVAAYEERYRSAREATAGRKTAGYVTDLETKDVTADMELYLLQYAVAPVIVVAGAGPDLVIGNFHTSKGAARVVGQARLSVVKDLGQGVMLLRRSLVQ